MPMIVPKFFVSTVNSTQLYPCFKYGIFISNVIFSDIVFSPFENNVKFISSQKLFLVSKSP